MLAPREFGGDVPKAAFASFGPSLLFYRLAAKALADVRHGLFHFPLLSIGAGIYIPSTIQEDETLVHAAQGV